jgi:enoyl-CoA hydratase
MPDSATSPSVSTTVEGDVTVIRIDDGKANALSFEVIDAVSAALTGAAERSKAVVVLGREGKFSAGFDLSVMTGPDTAQMLRLLGAGAELGLQVYMSPIPVVLGVTGHALAMGGILTTCADHRVGADGPFKIGLNEVAIGMPVPGFAIGMCRDRLRKTWFQRCLQLAYICSPAEAVEAGFLDEVVAPDAVADRALEVATGLASYVHPGPFRATRTGMRGETAEQLRAGLARDLGAFDVTPA